MKRWARISRRHAKLKWEIRNKAKLGTAIQSGVVLERRGEERVGIIRNKEIQPVHSKDEPWMFCGRNDAKAETPILWPPHAKR